eukprot:9244300-Prorocentrum_lima.AAC.1
MRAHSMYDLIGVKLMTIDYVPSQENAADALTKGLDNCNTPYGQAVAALGRNGSIVQSVPLKVQGECAC